MALPDVLVRRMGLMQQHYRNVLHGSSLPTTKDLLRLCPYMANDLRRDMQVFADIAARRVRTNKSGASILKQAFQNLTQEGAALKDVLYARRMLTEHGENVLGTVTAEAFLARCELYAASLNHRPMVEKAWRRCFQLAADAENHIDAFLYLQAALGWYTVGNKGWSKEDLRDIRYAGESTLDLAFAVWRAMRTPAQPKSSESQLQESPKTSVTPDMAGHLTVLETVTNSDMPMGRRVADEFKKVLRVSLPMTRSKDIQVVQDRLIAEFPWTGTVTRILLAEAGARPSVHFRPTILLGPPGSGKTRYCHRLLTLLGIKHRTYSCGGVVDSSFSGTSRHWANAEPSVPLSLIRQFEVANPGIILDEIDKASESRHNGSLFDVLLAMTEPQSAASWYDPYIQAPINLSGVLWLGTANDASDIPSTLRDRFRILSFNAPRAEHLEALARTLMAEIVGERGLLAEWARPLSWDELDALWKVWDGGSVRALKRLLEGVLNAREAEATQAEAN